MIPKKVIKSRYLIRLFDQKTCNKCEVFKEGERPNDICSTCPAFTANYRLFKETEKYWSLPQGDYLSLMGLLDRKGINYKVDDRRESHPFKFDIKFTGKLFGKDYVDDNGIPRINQKKLVKEYREYGEGILRALPRSGKTLMSIYLAIKAGERFVVLANRKELLKQFYWSMVGHPNDKSKKPFTNIPELQEETGREIIRLVENTKKDIKSLKNVDILLINYQKGVHDNDRIAKIIEDGGYSTLIIDEVHGAGAEGYLRIVAKASVKRRIGLTATPRRKDKRHVLIERVVGPVVAESKASSLIPNIRCLEVKAKPPSHYKMWQYAIKWLVNSKERNKQIVAQAFKDLRNGHEVIIIPVDQKGHQKTLVKMINNQAEYNNQERGEDWPIDLALAYNANSNREAILKQVDEPGPTILVPIRSMVKEGIDFLRPSAMYIVIPMSAAQDEKTGAPAFFQLANRVCTPYKKPPPVIRVFVDSVNMFKGALSGLIFREVLPNSKPKDGERPRYIMEDVEYEKFKLALKKDGGKNGRKPVNMKGWA